MIKNFRIGVIWRVLFLSACLALWVYLLLETQFYVSIALLTVFIGIQVARLIKYVEQTNKELARFLDSIRYSDFSQSFRDQGLGRSFEQLAESFSRVIDKFKQERAEKHENYRYLQTVVQHIGIGLISFNQKGEVELINTAAKRLFDIRVVRNIKKLKKISEPLFEAVTSLKSGNRTLVSVTINNKTLQLSISATEFRMQDKLFKLVSFQNIHSELEEKEMEAWQNLTQVLAHEIMNSVTPIASLSDTVHSLLEQRAPDQNGNKQIREESLGDVKEALETIQNRSRGLMRFVNSYRDFTQIPDPSFEMLQVKQLLQEIENLHKGEAKSQNVDVSVHVDPKSLEVTADPHLIEQVLINLTKNAFRAVEKTRDPEIQLIGKLDKKGRAVIQVKDNGPGIKSENLQKIFIPFYSTSQAGSRGSSGIGLSLSRQIMRKHRGTLTVQSNKETGTVFTLRF